MRSLLICFFLWSCQFKVQAQLFKNKRFTPEQAIPAASLSFTIDETYRLYIRRICKPLNTADSPDVYANSVAAYECPAPSPEDMLTEIQYLYYSAEKRIAIFIMLIPNYPGGQGGLIYNQPAVKDKQTVNLWSFNCALFGKMNAANDTISFKQWDKPFYDKWHVSFMTDGSMEVKGGKQGGLTKDTAFMSVSENLSVNVIYRPAKFVYPITLDGSCFTADPYPCGNVCSLVRKFYYQQDTDDSKKYALYFKYDQCTPPKDRNTGIRFDGVRGRNSRLPYEVAVFFK